MEEKLIRRIVTGSGEVVVDLLNNKPLKVICSEVKEVSMGGLTRGEVAKIQTQEMFLDDIATQNFRLEMFKCMDKNKDETLYIEQYDGKNHFKLQLISINTTTNRFITLVVRLDNTHWIKREAEVNVWNNNR